MERSPRRMANILFDVALASTVLVVTAALMLGPANDCRAADADARRKVIIDQDAFGPAGSNMQAILMLLQSKDVEVLGITIPSGDGWRDEEVSHTLRLLEIAQRAEIPVYPGAVFPLVNTQSRTSVLLIPVSAVNFAQSAQSQGLISQSQVATALTQAHQQLATLQSTGVNSGTNTNPNPVTNDNPNPAFVVTSSNGQLAAVPVVLGLSNGSMYEVLSGLSEGQTIATSTSNGG